MNSSDKSDTTGTTLKARLQLNSAKTAQGSPPAEDTRKGVQSIDKAFSLLRLFEASPNPMAINALAEASGMTAPQVHHYLVSLVRSGVVRQTRNGSYELGTYAIQLGLTALSRIEPVEQATNAARTLRDETGEAVFIALWGSHGPTIIRYFEGFQPVTVEVRTGNVLPVETSATGQVFMAWGSKAVIEQHVDMNRDTRRQIEQTRESGLGRVDGSLLPRVAALSAPVFDYENRLAFALTVLGWTGELDISPDGPLAERLSRAAADLSSDLGYRNGQDI